MDFLKSLRSVGKQETKVAMDVPYRPQTITESLDSQISFYEKKIADLKEAKAAISPEVEKALNALAKISY